MRKIIYYVATSIDGYIAGPDEDLSPYLYQGEGVARYKADLLKFKTTIMGRKTYEAGYQFGLKPGQPAYQGMRHYLFSNHLAIPNLDSAVSIMAVTLENIHNIKTNSPTDIYLCGGGTFAGWLARNGLIDQLKIKLNPIALGNGTKLFDKLGQTIGWQLTDTTAYDDGMIMATYDLYRK